MGRDSGWGMEPGRQVGHGRTWLALSLAGAVALAAAFAGLAVPAGGPAAAEEAPAVASGEYGSLDDGGPTDVLETVKLEPFYDEVQAEYQKQGYQPTQDIRIEIPATKYSAVGDGRFSVEKGLAGKADPALMWKDEESWVEWTINVPVSGLYNLGLEYYPLHGKRASIQRDIKVDGVYPFNEAKRLLFTRMWHDAEPVERDNQNNDIRPRQGEIPRWKFDRLRDAEGMYRYPLEFYLSAGKHVIRMTAIREPMAITKLVLASPTRLPDYEQVAASYETKGYQEVQDAFIRLEAEEVVEKSDPTIRREYTDDPKATPQAAGDFRLNSFGGDRWRKGGQWATWKITVPEDGLYKIGVRTWQGYTRLPHHRAVLIDGKIPFAELEEFSFPYEKEWQVVTLGKDEKNPYLFYMTKGEHEITMEVRIGPMRDVIRTLEDVSRDMAVISRKIIMITGFEPDKNFEWDLDKRIPDLVDQLGRLAKRMDDAIAKSTEIAGRRPTVANAMATVSQQLHSMERDPNSIPRRLEQFSTSQSSLTTWSLELRNQQILFDTFYVTAPTVKWPNPIASFWSRFTIGFSNFLASFRKNYTGIGSVYDEGDTVLTVWVARGREWVEIMKEMIEEDFTPSTGIKVNLNVLPGGALGGGPSALILSLSAGKPPDVAFAVDGGIPVELALRGAAVDLSKLPNYKEVAARFRPGALIPFQYKGGDYAIPETQDFTMLFYRKDILDAKKLKVPDTWDDVKAMIPRLQETGMDFYYYAVLSGHAPGLTPLLFQRGGDYYDEQGLKSGLDTPEALDAFTEWTEFYSNFKIAKIADFFNRMRTGDMPIGVGGYWQYVLLSTAAPELTGWWGIAPMPGVRRPDGTIDRSTGGGSSTAMIFQASKKQKEAWELIKWWTSAEIQERYGQELEALLGVEARWNTANVEAMRNLPWPSKDIEFIMEQWNWFKEQPVVLGGYFTGQHVENAWARTVVNGMNPRESLELAVKDINRELRRKQEEFGIDAAAALRDPQSEAGK